MLICPAMVQMDTSYSQVALSPRFISVLDSPPPQRLRRVTPGVAGYTLSDGRSGPPRQPEAGAAGGRGGNV